MLYFVRSDRDDSPVKIGYAQVVEARLAELQRFSPFPLRLVRQMEGSLEDEFRLHRHFKSLRLHGEWFVWSDEMLTVGLSDLPDRRGNSSKRTEIWAIRLSDSEYEQIIAAGARFNMPASAWARTVLLRSLLVDPRDPSDKYAGVPE